MCHILHGVTKEWLFSMIKLNWKVWWKFLCAHTVHCYWRWIMKEQYLLNATEYRWKSARLMVNKQLGKFSTSQAPNKLLLFIWSLLFSYVRPTFSLSLWHTYQAFGCWLAATWRECRYICHPMSRWQILVYWLVEDDIICLCIVIGCVNRISASAHNFRGQQGSSLHTLRSICFVIESGALFTIYVSVCTLLFLNMYSLELISHYFYPRRSSMNSFYYTLQLYTLRFSMQKGKNKIKQRNRLMNDENDYLKFIFLPAFTVVR